MNRGLCQDDAHDGQKITRLAAPHCGAWSHGCRLWFVNHRNDVGCGSLCSDILHHLDDGIGADVHHDVNHAAFDDDFSADHHHDDTLANNHHHDNDRPANDNDNQTTVDRGQHE